MATNERLYGRILQVIVGYSIKIFYLLEMFRKYIAKSLKISYFSSTKSKNKSLMEYT